MLSSGQQVPQTTPPLTGAVTNTPIALAPPQAGARIATPAFASFSGTIDKDDMPKALLYQAGLQALSTVGNIVLAAFDSSNYGSYLNSVTTMSSDANYTQRTLGQYDRDVQNKRADVEESKAKIYQKMFNEQIEYQKGHDKLVASFKTKLRQIESNEKIAMGKLSIVMNSAYKGSPAFSY